MEAITPIIGWLIGHSATSFIDASFIEAWDHWVAFVILFALGLHMLYEGMKPSDETAEAPSRHSFFQTCFDCIWYQHRCHGCRCEPSICKG
ncbi:manganese efflux pump MntP family protein [Psychrobacter sp. JCM 18900]|uniref:manganese efflux pump MntP family protein n=1 Tax=Psychrobacter sp. JCM 18900 TaxID=1298608 RepID=UPI0021C4C7C8|nr:manganese efflux pump MntP family protein [Psychrobacter sp. JCM 18900]